MRPSYNRIPYRGAPNSLEGQYSLPSVLGPLAHSVTGIKIFTKSVIDAKPWITDPIAVNQPWQENAYELAEYGGGKQLVRGFIWGDGHTKPHPPIIRAQENDKRYVDQSWLQRYGHAILATIFGL